MKFISSFLSLCIVATDVSAGIKHPDISRQLFELCRQRASNVTEFQQLLQENGWEPTEINTEELREPELRVVSPEWLVLLFGFVQDHVGDNETTEMLEPVFEEYIRREPYRIMVGFYPDEYEIFSNGYSLFSYKFSPSFAPRFIECNYSGPSEIQVDQDHSKVRQKFLGKNISRYNINDGKHVERVFRIDGSYASKIFQREMESQIFFSTRREFNQ